ncbi:hypothetical protein GLV94_02985 [Virgibacillus halodenitrificans]|uniref:phage minor capsid protein n=1 Tax=Virgibacillus halodenitrificans TaxID=1482 RepID=UPI00136AF6BE|nr:phage minor capsid protein [Virgibacillus halodenitrificans]MYL44598.1 hypothetical protein [Virgibacillus halodenitrificans]
MQSEKLLEVIKALKFEVLTILESYDISIDEQAAQALEIIDAMFERLNLAVEDVIPEDMLSSYFQGVDEASNLLNSVGITPVGGTVASYSNQSVRDAFKKQVHMAAVGEVTENTMLDLQAAIRTSQQNAYFTLKTTLEEVKSELQGGVIRGNAKRKVTAKVAEAFVKDGLTAFVTVDGKKLPLDFYSETVVRTNLKDANVKGATNRNLENDIELVQIHERSDGCAECAKYDGMVVSLTGEHEGYPTVNEAPLPPRHPNCRGSVRPYVLKFKTEQEIEQDKERWENFDPEKDIRSKRDKRAYEEQQARNRKSNYEKKRYAEIKSVLGDDAPKTLGAFKRMKRSRSSGYKELMKKYQKAE